MADNIRGELLLAGFNGDFDSLEEIVNVLAENGFSSCKELDSCCAAQDIRNFSLLDVAGQAFVQLVIECATDSGRMARAQRKKPRVEMTGPCPSVIPERAVAVEVSVGRPRRYCMKSKCDWGIINTLHKVLSLFDRPRLQPLMPVAGMGPAKAAKALGVSCVSARDKADWLSRARDNALLGSCPRTLPSIKSGIRAFHAFCVGALQLEGEWIPPAVVTLVAWSELFRCCETYRNYLGYVRFACTMLDLPTDAFDSRDIKRALSSIRKRHNFVPRRKLFIQRELVGKLLTLPAKGELQQHYAILYLLTYVFLLRLPSEALPCTKTSCGIIRDAQSQIWCDGVEVHLQLKRRKNMDGGSQLSRKCWCVSSPATCPVHVLWPFFAALPDGAEPFAGINAGRALKTLRQALRSFPATRKESGLYRCHDLRRGHAKDLASSGAPLVEILQAGQWRSPAFLSYLDLKSLERDAVLAACVDDSSGGEEEACTIGTNPLPPICPPSHSVVDDDAGILRGFGDSDDELFSMN